MDFKKLKKLMKAQEKAEKQAYKGLNKRAEQIQKANVNK